MPTDTEGWNLDNSYARLPEPFLAKAKPVAVRAPKAVVLNFALADELGLNLRAMPAARAAALFAGQELPSGAEPIAQAYAGHQYGGFTMLGDGRAILLGEQITPDGRRFDIQLKGPGPTPFSRRGDGRAALGPMLREYIISEAMHALGIPTTRSLAVVMTGEPVYRERVQPGAVLTRVAASHIRVGTFQYLAARRDEPNLKLLADYTIARHYPDIPDGPGRYLSFYRAVMDRQAALVAKWQCVGFVHGVLNTDNVPISGETIDYGPCAFMDAYDPDTVFSSIDSGGRYAYGNQPGITQWNLARFAETLLPLLNSDQQTAVEIATAELNRFPELFEAHFQAGMRAKLGLRTERDDDPELVQALLNELHSAKADFTNTFSDLSAGEELAADLYARDGFCSWRARWESRLEAEGTSREEARARMRTANPVAIPRNHRVEEALAAAEAGDLSVMEQLVQVLQRPFERTAEAAAYRTPAPAGCGYRTFCGT